MAALVIALAAATGITTTDAMTSCRSLATMASKSKTPELILNTKTSTVCNAVFSHERTCFHSCSLMACRNKDRGPKGVLSESRCTDANVEQLMELHKPLMKAIRALTHAAKKRTSNQNILFGAGSKILTLIFTLKKLPERSARETIKVALPSPLVPGQSVDGHFMKVGSTKSLSFPFGLCNMEEEPLLLNAKKVIGKVKEIVDLRKLVCEIRVKEMDGLSLPIYDSRLEERRLKKAAAKSIVYQSAMTSRAFSKRKSDSVVMLMAPPLFLPAKKARRDVAI
eukprot:TRINITY_DN93184_c0_g1_i1.p1 TRINITY_DN93184_c0_g1~~TRINITY_DN93184_c0_g1_i1.p1  ORF type:complete len:281 (+),score=34.86 TRINITY_DN93184_c0_g1_i1:188-1030(+)